MCLSSPPRSILLTLPPPPSPLSLSYLQLATRLPEWHKITFTMQPPQDLEAAKGMLAEELYIHPKNIKISENGDVVVQTAGTLQ